MDITGGSTYVIVGCIVDGFSTSTSATSVETTCLGDTYKTFQRSDIDPGSLDFSIAYDAQDNTTTRKLVDLFNSGDVASWEITFSDEGSGTATENFLGFVESFNREITKESLVSASLTIKVSGDSGMTGVSV